MTATSESGATSVPKSMTYIRTDPNAEGRHLWRDNEMAKVFAHGGALKSLKRKPTGGLESTPETETGHDGIYSYTYDKGSRECKMSKSYVVSG